MSGQSETEANGGDQEWRQEACAALESAGASREALEAVKPRILQILVDAASEALERDGHAATWTETRDRLERVRRGARELARALAALSSDDLALARGENPFESRQDLNLLAFERFLDANAMRTKQILNGDSESRIEDYYENERDWDAFVERYQSGFETGLLELSEIPALNKEAAVPGETSFEYLVDRLADALDLRMTLLSELSLEGPGRASLQARLFVSPRKKFVRMCCQLFERYALKISDAETGAFFRFCAAIYDHAAGEVVFTRDKSFRDLVKALKTLRGLRTELVEIHEQIALLPGTPIALTEGAPETDMISIHPKALKEFAALTDRENVLDDQIVSLVEEIYGPQQR